MKILIVEDEIAIARRMSKLLKEIDETIEVPGILGSIESAVGWLKAHAEPDLILMDIHLADGSSFEIFNEVQVNCPVIFATAYDQYAIQAFKVNSIDYLLKPVSKEDLAESLRKYRKYRTTSTIPIDYSMLAGLL